jgi:hypothetical protein
MVRLTSPPERRQDSPDERAQIGKWLKLADAALKGKKSLKRKAA